MAKSNKARYAVLGILSMQDASGYDIKKIMERSTDHIWKESDASIYPALKWLLAKKLVVCKIQNHTGARLKKVYIITKDGKNILKQWLTEDPEPLQNRNELLLKVFFGKNNDPQYVINHIENFRTTEAKKFEQYNRLFLKQKTMHNQSIDNLYKFLALKAGILTTEARLRWCGEAIDALTNNKN